MTWSFEDDKSEVIITAKKHINSSHANKYSGNLPDTCVIFEIGIAMSHLEENYNFKVLAEKLPCFLDNPKCITIEGINNVCFTRGGYAAPSAVDTLETLIALGVKRVIIAGMCGVFSENIDVGDVIVPHRILSEEGTSRHYVNNHKYSSPNKKLYEQAVGFFKDDFMLSKEATVTTDSIYRQTFYKENYWREQGCVGVDMESSALLTVSNLYGISAVSILLASDKHPISKEQSDWEWGNNKFKETKKRFIDKCVAFSRSINNAL